jgi:DNA segregation ATPase FtsK/SpoIIIE-like protein
MKKKNIIPEGLEEFVDAEKLFDIFTEEDEDDKSLQLISGQLFSERAAGEDISKVCRAVDRNGFAVIIKDDELRYAVITMEEYKRLKNDRKNSCDREIAQSIEREQKKQHPSRNAEDDQLICKVLEYVSTLEGVSTSVLQRKFNVGYGRAAMFIDYLEHSGFISPYSGCKPRDVIATKELFDEAIARLNKL